MATPFWLQWLRSAILRHQTARPHRKAPPRCPAFPRPLLEELEERTAPAVFTVTNTLDDGGAGSLRWAINQANADTDPVSTIDFTIPGSGAQTIHVGSSTAYQGQPLPTIMHPVVIDGYSQAGASRNTQANSDQAVLRIELDGSGAALGGFNGPGLLDLTGGSSTVSGLVLNGFASGVGIQVQGQGGNWIWGNFIGTDVSGTQSRGGQGGYGIQVLGGSSYNLIGTNGDGANDYGERNLIDNSFGGVVLRGVDGSFNIPAGGLSGYNVIAGNFVGVDSTGTHAVPNTYGLTTIQGAHYDTVGVVSTDRVHPDHVDYAAERNVVSGNFGGILFDGGTANPPSETHGLIAGNYIGTDATGLQALGNAGGGVGIAELASSCQVGGTTPALANLIADNGGPGVWIFNLRQQGSPTGITVRGNSIHDNAGLGIDLGGDFPSPGPDGVTLNGSQAGSGPNNWQYFPALTSVISSSTDTAITGTFKDPNEPGQTITLDFYASTIEDPSGYGQGQTYLGSTTATADVNGDATFAVDFAVGNLAGQWISATATDPSGDTSEFSANVLVRPPHPYVVTTTADSGPGSLRDAITQINADTRQTLYPSPTDPTKDEIDFALPWGDAGHVYYQGGVGNIIPVPANTSRDADLANPAIVGNSNTVAAQWPNSWWRIQPTSDLPAITTSVLLDGYTQTGALANNQQIGDNAVLRVELNGSLLTMDGAVNGLQLGAPNDTVRGLVVNGFAWHGSPISNAGHVFNGIRVDSRAVLLAGNFIGTDVSGTLSVANDGGITVLPHAANGRIGIGSIGVVAHGDANIVSGNRGWGILLAGDGADNNIVAGNSIGTDRNGNALTGGPYDNGAFGVGVFQGASGNQLVANTIAYNGGPGIWVPRYSTSMASFGTHSGVGNSIRGNSSHDNAGLGIDLGGTVDSIVPFIFSPDGVTLNDSQGHTGPNNFLDFPVLASAISSSTDTSVTGNFSSGTESGLGSVPMTLDVYANTSADPSSHGQGKTYLGSTTVTTDANGNATFVADLAVGNLAGQWITATTTDPQGNTSEFALDVQATAAPGQTYAQYLQAALPQSATTANSVTLQASVNTTPATVIAAVNGLTNVTQPVTVILDLGGGTYSSGGVAANPPANVTFVVQNGTLDPNFPALTVAGGQVAVFHCTLITTGDAPTILVTGGNLTLRNDVVQESTGFTDAAIAVTGGTVDLGTASSPGNNTININGTGQLVQNTTANPVSAVGNTFETGGTVLPAPTLSFTALTTSAAITIPGQPVTFSVTVRTNGSGSGTPTGSVDFLDTSTNTDLGTVALSSGSAALTTSALGRGMHVIQANYSGDNTFLLSLASVAQTVIQSIYILNKTESGALSVSGHGSINIPGTLFVDSKSSTALIDKGNAQITAASIQVVGGVKVSGNATLTPATTGVAVVPDPLLGLLAPTGGTAQGSVQLTSGSLTINPGVYKSIKVSGTGSLTLNPGVYIITGGGITVSGNSSLTGSGVLLYNAGKDFCHDDDRGGIKLSGNGTFHVSAPASGPYAGVVIFQARDNTRAISLSKNALAGALHIFSLAGREIRTYGD